MVSDKLVVHVETYEDIYDVIPNYDPKLDTDIEVVVSEITVTDVTDTGESLLAKKETYTDKELHVAFDYIKDESNWKNPIVALVPSDMLKVCEEAAIYFAGSPLEVYPTDCPETFVVEGAGYYNCIGA